MQKEGRRKLMENYEWNSAKWQLFFIDGKFK